MTVHLWRVASDTPSWTADDLSGKGAASKGARWNHPADSATYADGIQATIQAVLESPGFLYVTELGATPLDRSGVVAVILRPAE